MGPGRLVRLIYLPLPYGQVRLFIGGYAYAKPTTKHQLPNLDSKAGDVQYEARSSLRFLKQPVSGHIPLPPPSAVPPPSTSSVNRCGEPLMASAHQRQRCICTLRLSSKQFRYTLQKEQHRPRSTSVRHTGQPRSPAAQPAHTTA